MPDPIAQRRDILAASLMTALPFLLARTAHASPINPAQTIAKLPPELVFTKSNGAPDRSVENCDLFSDPTQPGIYYSLVRWWPGYMSAPHFYSTDRLCVVLSGTWWVNSGPDFDPASCVPAPAGSFVHRIALTPHYDGVPRDKTEPATIAICGIGPVNYTSVDKNLKSPIKI